MSPIALVTGWRARISGGGSKDRGYVRRKRAEKRPAMVWFRAALYVDLQRRGLSHHPRAGFADGSEVSRHALVTRAVELETYIGDLVVRIDPDSLQNHCVPLECARQQVRRAAQIADQAGGSRRYRTAELDLAAWLEGNSPTVGRRP